MLRFYNNFIKLSIILLLMFISFILCLYLYAYLSPKISIKKANKYFIYDSHNNIVYQGSSSNKWVKLDDISKYYIDAVISIEDKNFYKHILMMLIQISIT